MFKFLVGLICVVIGEQFS